MARQEFSLPYSHFPPPALGVLGSVSIVERSANRDISILLYSSFDIYPKTWLERDQQAEVLLVMLSVLPQKCVRAQHILTEDYL
jgi:hypothetical protein